MELHDKYGVPNFETSKELAWDKETNFYWVVYNGERFLHSASEFHKKVLKEWEEQYHLEWDDSDKLRKEAKTPIERKPFWLNERYNYGKIKVIEEILHSLFGVKEDDLIIKSATDWLEAEEIEFIPAPQMHELLLYLPKYLNLPHENLYEGTRNHPLKFEYNGSIKAFIVSYELKSDNFSVSAFSRNIKNNNFSQSLAEIHIQLKENKLL